MIEMGLNMEVFAKPKPPKPLEQKKDKDHRPKIRGSVYKAPPPLPRPVPKGVR